MQENGLSSVEEIYELFSQVRLDDEGRFKYILIHMELEGEEEPLEFVRGWKSCMYHANIFDKFRTEELVARNALYKGKKLTQQVKLSCPGGGRIVHDKGKQELAIYGYSQSYGQADHNRVVEILKKYLAYPADNFKVSFEGY